MGVIFHFPSVMEMGWCVCVGERGLFQNPLISESVRGHLCPEGKLRPTAPSARTPELLPHALPGWAPGWWARQGLAPGLCPFAGQAAQLSFQPTSGVKPPRGPALPCCSAERGRGAAGGVGGAQPVISHLLHSTAGASFPLQRPRGAGQGHGLAGAERGRGQVMGHQTGPRPGRIRERGSQGRRSQIDGRDSVAWEMQQGEG